jgi:pyruvate dehydrogenase E1 component beta subunit
VVRRPGDDVTIVAPGYMGTLALQAAEQLAAGGVSAEVIDPRTLEPFDLGTVVDSVTRTGALVVVDEDHVRAGGAAEICMAVLEAAPGALRSAPRRVACAHVPLPEGPAELQALPSVERIAEAAITAVS